MADIQACFSPTWHSLRPSSCLPGCLSPFRLCLLKLVHTLFFGRHLGTCKLSWLHLTCSTVAVMACWVDFCVFLTQSQSGILMGAPKHKALLIFFLLSLLPSCVKRLGEGESHVVSVANGPALTAGSLRWTTAPDREWSHLVLYFRTQVWNYVFYVSWTQVSRKWLNSATYVRIFGGFPLDAFSPTWKKFRGIM